VPITTNVVFSPVSSTNKTDRYDKNEIWLQVALNTITHLPLYECLTKLKTENNKCVVKINA